MERRIVIFTARNSDCLDFLGLVYYNCLDFWETNDNDCMRSTFETIAPAKCRSPGLQSLALPAIRIGFRIASNFGAYKNRQ